MRLLKGLYGLKQAGRVWNEELLKALKDLDFVQLQSDSCVFCLQTGSVNRVFAAVWVDNIHLFGQLDADVMHVVDRFVSSTFIDPHGPLQGVGQKACVRQPKVGAHMRDKGIDHVFQVVLAGDANEMVFRIIGLERARLGPRTCPWAALCEELRGALEEDSRAAQARAHPLALQQARLYC